MDFEDTGLAKDDNGDGTINDATPVGEKIGESKLLVQTFSTFK